MKGFVLTPTLVVDSMVEKLFRPGPPARGAELLDPGCGTGEFIDGVLRWCRTRGVSPPRITGIDSDARRAAEARARFAGVRSVRISESDFLIPSARRYDYILGNPPYVPITALTTRERHIYRAAYSTARGRFDLYLLFFEQALRLLKPDGRLVFITPEKFLYVATASPLRQLLGAARVEELHFLSEDTFDNLITYPLISTVIRAKPPGRTRVVRRDGTLASVSLAAHASSWMPAIQGASAHADTCTLADVCLRISCGVATGADSVFVLRNTEVPRSLLRLARPTLAGRQLGPDKPLQPTHSMLLPYRADGSLLPERELGKLAEYLAEPSRQKKLLGRTCVSYKPWYAFHETPPMPHLLRPKILCKDIGAAPYFAVDREGTIVPRHSVYYIVPASPDLLEELAAYLNSPPAHRWLTDHCQRAASGFIRLQSHVLKRLPVPSRFAVLQPQLFSAVAS